MTLVFGVFLTEENQYQISCLSIFASRALASLAACVDYMYRAVAPHVLACIPHVHVHVHVHAAAVHVLCESLQTSGTVYKFSRIITR